MAATAVRSATVRGPSRRYCRAVSASPAEVTEVSAATESGWTAAAGVTAWMLSGVARASASRTAVAVAGFPRRGSRMTVLLWGVRRDGTLEEMRRREVDGPSMSCFRQGVEGAKGPGGGSRPAGRDRRRRGRPVRRGRPPPTRSAPPGPSRAAPSAGTRHCPRSTGRAGRTGRPPSGRTVSRPATESDRPSAPPRRPGRGQVRRAVANPCRRSVPPPPTSGMSSSRQSRCAVCAAASQDTTVTRSRRPPTAREISATSSSALPNSASLTDPDVSTTTVTRGGRRRREGSTAPGTAADRRAGRPYE